MLQPYHDIIDRLGVPLWWDEVGCPRYDAFRPGMCSNIYASEAVLLLIACQACGRKMHVALSRDEYWEQIAGHLGGKGSSLADSIRDGSLHYGDAPCWVADVQCGGTTMSCEDLQVKEYWRRGHGRGWERDSSLEINLPDLLAD